MADSRLQGFFHPSISSLTWTSLASLANGSAAECAEFDNSALLFLGADLEVNIKSHASSTPAGYVTIYMAPSLDGSAYPGGAAGADAGITAQTDNLIRVGSLYLAASNTTYRKVMDLSAAYGMQLPSWFSLVALNNSGFALNASGSSARLIGKKVSAIGV